MVLWPENLTACGIAFVAMFAIDYAYARYILRTGERRPVPAGAWAAVIAGLNAVMTLSFVADPWAGIAAAAGAFLGTVVSIRHESPG